MKRILILSSLALTVGLLAATAVLANSERVTVQTRRSVSSSAPRAASSDLTQVRVYVLSRGGKYIGDDIGGAQVTLRDARTGEFIASGRTRGGAGPDVLVTGARASRLSSPNRVFLK